MKTAEATRELEGLTKRLLHSNNEMLEAASAWTRSSDRVRTITVDGKEAVLIG
jgi:hypothetical protein